MANKSVEGNCCAWITWENQRRNPELASAFGADFFAIVFDNQGRLARYARSALQTLRILLGYRLKTVFVQNPSLILSLIAVSTKYLLGTKVVVDAHNAALEYCSSPNKIVGIVGRFVVSKADYLIVTNSHSAKRAAGLGANPVVLPDKLPHIEDVESPNWLGPSGGPVVTLIASFAEDEPIREFLEAVLPLKGRLQVYVTGNKRKAGELLNYESSSVKFTGFLSNQDFEGLIRYSDLLVDLTTREDCLVCGGYEALAVKTPVLLSDNLVSKETFGPHLLYCDNTTPGIRASIEQFVADQDKAKQGVVLARDEFAKRWQAHFEQARKMVFSD